MVALQEKSFRGGDVLDLCGIDGFIRGVDRTLGFFHAEQCISSREHADIARAIASGDPELAAASTLVHLRRALAHLQGAGIPTDSTALAASAEPAHQEATA